MAEPLDEHPVSSSSDEGASAMTRRTALRLAGAAAAAPVRDEGWPDMEQMSAGASALARYARVRKSGEQLDAAADLVDARVAFDVARAEPERALAEARSAYDARYRSARDAGWTTEELRAQWGCRPPVFDEVRPAVWLPRWRPGAG